MKNALKYIFFGCTIVSILACSAGNVLLNQTPAPPSTLFTLSPPTALPTNVVRGGGPPSLTENVTITSQSSYTKTEDINNFISNNVISDPEALAVMNWARDIGYYPKDSHPNDATKAVFSNNVTLYIVDFISNNSQPIAFLRFVVPEGKGLSMMATLEGDQNDPILVLFNQSGQIRYSKDGLKVDEPLNSSKIVPVSLLSSIDPQNNTCPSVFSGWFDRWGKCMKNNQSAGYLAVAGCVAAIKIYQASAGGNASAIRRNPVGQAVNTANLLAAIVACGASAVLCVSSAFTDWPPVLTAEINLMVGKIYSTCTKTTQYTESQAFQVVVKVEDDRPDPKPSGYVEILPPNASANYSAEDCAHQWSELKVHTPDSPTYVYDCPSNQVCQQAGTGNIECVPGDVKPPIIQPPAVQPPETTTNDKTYQGQLCETKDSTGPGDCRCKAYYDETFTLKFNADGSLTQYNNICPNKRCDPNYRSTWSLVSPGLYVFDSGDPTQQYHISLEGNGLTYIDDWYPWKGSPACSIKTNFAQISP